MIRITFLPELNFMNTTYSGRIDDCILKAHVAEINRKAKNLKGACELADCRPIDDLKDLSVNACVEAGGMKIGQTRAEGGLLAIVVATVKQYGLARAYTVYPNDIRKRILITYSIEEATEWFSFNANETIRVRGCLSTSI